MAPGHSRVGRARDADLHRWVTFSNAPRVLGRLIPQLPKTIEFAAWATGAAPWAYVREAAQAHGLGLFVRTSSVCTRPCSHDSISGRVTLGLARPLTRRVGPLAPDCEARPTPSPQRSSDDQPGHSSRTFPTGDPRRPCSDAEMAARGDGRTLARRRTLALRAAGEDRRGALRACRVALAAAVH